MGVALLAVAALGLPLAFAASRLLRGEAISRLDRQAEGVGFAVEDRVEHQERPTAADLARLVSTGQRVTVTDAAGHRVTAGHIAPGPHLAVSVVAVEGSRIRLEAPSGELTDRIHRAWALVAGLGLAALGMAGGLALFSTGRLTVPVRRLVDAARRLGSGDFSARAETSGVTELDEVAHALNHSAHEIGALVATERQFSVDASHQLRTPLTALRIRVEELLASERDDERRRELEAVLAQADRLAATIQDLVAFRHRGRVGEAQRLDVANLVGQHVRFWSVAFRRAGRRLVATNTGDCCALATAGAVGQALDVLIDNALAHGAGTVSVSSRVDGPSVTVAVTDEGGGVPSDHRQAIFARHVSLEGSSGLGLDLARALIESEGGRLRLVDGQPTTFEVTLRRWSGEPRPDRPAIRSSS